MMTLRYEGDHTTIRWLPRQGKPSGVIETISQTIIKIVAFLPIYIAIVVTLTLLLQFYLLYH